MDTYLITGGTGFIGQAVVKELLSAQPHVSIRSLSLPTDIAPTPWHDDVDVVYGDITSQADVHRATEGVSHVIHLAALLGSGSYAAHRAVTVEGTGIVLEAACKQGARTVVVSSIAAYGDYVRDLECSEALGHGPHNGPYALAKQQQENLAMDFARHHGGLCCVARPANVTGAGSLPWVTVIAAALKAGAPILVDGGHGDAGLIHVDDVARALISLSLDGVSGQAYNVSGDMSVSWARYFSDLADILQLSLPDSVSYDYLYEIARRDEDPEKMITPNEYRAIPLATLALIGSNNRFPNTKLRDATDWQPQVGYEETIQEIRNALTK